MDEFLKIKFLHKNISSLIKYFIKIKLYKYIKLDIKVDMPEEIIRELRIFEKKNYKPIYIILFNEVKKMFEIYDFKDYVFFNYKILLETNNMKEIGKFILSTVNYQ